MQFEKLAQFSEEQMQLYPTQPELYYYNGLANNQLKNYKKAKDALETGVDFIVENPTLEVNFYLQLSETYNGLGDLKKKDSYFAKANELAKKLKK
jgi:tetratricopeptide (TPR) repeat protein